MSHIYYIFLTHVPGQALKRLPAYLRMAALEVTEEYRAAFMRALETVRHQLVLCPRLRELRPLTQPTG